MTKEVAKKIVRGITDKIECNTIDIDDWAEFWGFTREEYEEFLDMAIKSLEQTRWIPVSERLPNAYEFVNCTCHSLIDDREDWVIETVYIPQPSYSPYSDWGNIPMLNSGDCKVVAWMHRDIPEPYNAESEEEKSKCTKQKCPMNAVTINPDCDIKDCPYRTE